MHAELFVLLFAVATVVAVGARWLKLPYTVALVGAGLALGSTALFDPIHLTQEILFAVILPGLIFEAAFHLDAGKFWKERLPIHALAVPGLLVGIALTAAILVPTANALGFIQGFTLLDGLVFAALIAATDPIAVVGLFKSLGAPKRLAVLVEGESLVNDGTGVVVFTIALGAATGGALTLPGAVGEFVRVVGLGLLIGGAVGFAVSQAIRRIDDPMIELTLTVVAGYGSFVLAERFHASGVIATVVAGMLCGNYAARRGMSPTTRVAVETAWEYISFSLNSVVFLLIGLEVEPASLLAAWKPIVLGYLAMTAGRAVVVFAVSALLRRRKSALPWSWSAVLTWAGLRGGLSMVLALGLPKEFPHRELLVNMTFGVVLLSILVQGLTMGPLLRRLGIVGARSQVHEAYELWRAKLQGAGAALAGLTRLRAERGASAAVLGTLEEEYRGRLEEAEHSLKELHVEEETLRAEELLAARRQLLHAERDAAVQAAHHGLLGADGLERLLAEIDGRLAALDELAAPAPQEAPLPVVGAGS